VALPAGLFKSPVKIGNLAAGKVPETILVAFKLTTIESIYCLGAASKG